MVNSFTGTACLLRITKYFSSISSRSGARACFTRFGSSPSMNSSVFCMISVNGLVTLQPLGYVVRPYAPRHDTGSSSTWRPHVLPGRFRRTVGMGSRSVVWVCGSSDPDIDSRRNATIATHMAWRSIGRMNRRVGDCRTLCAIVFGATLTVRGVSACRAGRQQARTSYHPGCKGFRYRQFLIYILSNS